MKTESQLSLNESGAFSSGAPLTVTECIVSSAVHYFLIKANVNNSYTELLTLCAMLA